LGWTVTGVPGFDFGSGVKVEPIVVRRTEDGGATWTTASRPRKWLADTSLHFGDRDHGWAVWQASQARTHSRFDAVYRTSDGGHSWRAVAAIGIHRANDAWAGTESSGVLWRTTDGGRPWLLGRR
jgi:photosystem II stability/assembly factor-like uncharacterized protein